MTKYSGKPKLMTNSGDVTGLFVKGEVHSILYHSKMKDSTMLMCSFKKVLYTTEIARCKGC